jgi:hypothetical protein
MAASGSGEKNKNTIYVQEISLATRKLLDFDEEIKYNKNILFSQKP